MSWPEYVADLYRNRTRLRVRLLEEQFYSQQTPPGLRFEVENLGTTATSIEPIVRFHGFLPRPKGEQFADGVKLVPFSLDFKFDENTQRTLPPSTPITFTVANQLRAGRELSDRLGHMFFKTYTFAFTRGRVVKIRIRSADHEQLSWGRYVFERLHFALRGVKSLPKHDEPFELED